MTEYIKATIIGIYPKEDIDLIADFYGGEAAEDKEQFVIDYIEARIVEILSAPSKTAIGQTKQAETTVLMAELTERVKSSLSTTTETITGE